MGKKRATAGQDHVVQPPAGSLQIKTFPPTLTVSDIAAKLAPISTDEAGTVQKIRHWTREGVLPAAESEHDGPGVHRRYADSDAYSAAFLRVLSHFNFPISHSRILKTAMPQVRAKAAAWQAARQKGQTTKLVPITVGMTATGEFQVGEQLKEQSNVVLTLKIDLGKIFAGVDRGRS